MTLTKTSTMQTVDIVTDQNGGYAFNNIEANTTYTVTPAAPNYTFTPERQSFTNISTHVTANFSGAKPISIKSYDARFAPSVERFNIKYSISSSYTAAAAKLEIFKNGDAINPIYKDEGIPRIGTDIQYSQGGIQGWDGRANPGAGSGQYVQPKDSPFTVRISIATQASYSDAITDQKTTKVELESVSLTPSGNTKVYKPNRTAMEIDEPIEALVKIKNKSGSGVATQIPIKINWSFEDPDDTASSSVIDGNGGAGDDNAPIVNSGKRGAGSIMWKAVAGFTTTVAANGQTAVSETKTSGTDQGKTKITFATSAIAGDNYYLVARYQRDDASLVTEKKSGKWSVWKRLNFQNAYRMDGGSDVGSVMTVSNINPAYNGDGYTEYSVGSIISLVQGATSPEFAAPLPTPCASELPAAGDTTATITAKARAWYDRSMSERDTAMRALIALINPTRPAIIGARYAHEKLDGNLSTGQTSYYPAGIMITVFGGGQVDPDGDWYQPQGSEIDDVAFIWLNITSMNRKIIVGRHEVGHASDHERFGTGAVGSQYYDHAVSGLMHPSSDQQNNPPDGVGIFSGDSILRLRGWRR